MLLLLLACSSPPPPPELPFEQRPIDHKGVVRAFPSDRVKDREGWAGDLERALAIDSIAQTNGNVCSVVAAVEQESGYAPDPAVPGIGGMIDTWIEEKQASMKKLPAWAFGEGLRAVLDTKAPGATMSFYDKLHAAKTERDVDRTFREFLAWHRSRLPEPLKSAEKAARYAGLDLDDYNPITTAGCLQVKVDFSEEHARTHGTNPELVRDSLYTREGCLHYGTMRLLGWEASYDKPVYRFADYNAGYFASRNAAFQEQVATLLGKTLALDGDLLRYNENGSPASEPSQTLNAVLEVVTKYQLDLSESRVRRDLSREKETAFEETATWNAIREQYQKKTGKKPEYARLPDVALDSIKLSGNKTTAWFAQNVEKRYQSCMARVSGKK
jgi:hypothetical protein